jgi:hypothetical protein
MKKGPEKKSVKSSNKAQDKNPKRTSQESDNSAYGGLPNRGFLKNLGCG